MTPKHNVDLVDGMSITIDSHELQPHRLVRMSIRR